jgi:ribosome-binding ATPase
MKIGIIGLPQTGKKTLFGILTGYVFSEKDMVSGKAVKSLAEIRDPRFDALTAIYKPKKQVRARIDIELLPKIESDSIVKGDIFKDIAELDAVCHVVRGFKEEAVYHVRGSVDAGRDIDMVNSELILNDLLFIEKRLERLDKNLKKIKDDAGLKEKELFLKLKEHLDKEMPLRLFSLDPAEEKILTSYPFITRKKMIIVLNVSEEDLSDTAILAEMKRKYQPLDIDVMQVSAKVESEIVKLEDEKERREFLEALGIEEPAINVLTRLCIKALDLISFFTVGEDEVRQWTVKSGSSAPEAAGVIHSDLQKGFIRAELMKYTDLAEMKSEIKLKDAGKFYLKGKDYMVEDGDILSIRFNV